jgi:hypothetical protein
MVPPLARMIAGFGLALSACATRSVDRFGVRELYPTAPGGREWTLPDDAQNAGSEWRPETDDVVRLDSGVFETEGTAGEVRLTTHSPAGSAWWRNVEMTAYFRYAGDRPGGGQQPHFELLLRGERHYSAADVSADSLDDGVAAPQGTVTWPGYPYGPRTLDWHCLGTAYHGNVELDGTALFEKELSHVAGYAPQRGQSQVAGFSPSAGNWFGMKLVVRNAQHDTRAHLELWIDAAADGRWQKTSAYDDLAGAWVASDPALDGCTQEPFSYQPGQVVTWAGPWLIFRSDSILLDFKWLSARELAPLP